MLKGARKTTMQRREVGSSLPSVGTQSKEHRHEHGPITPNGSCGCVEKRTTKTSSRRRFLQVLEEEEHHLHRLCRAMEWKPAAKCLQKILALLLHGNTDDDAKSNQEFHHLSKSAMTETIKHQLLATDSWGNHSLHLVCYLNPPSTSNRFLRLLLKVARHVGCLSSLCTARNNQGLTPLLVACSSRNSRPMIKTLLECGDHASLPTTILVCDRTGKSPFSALLQCYHLFAKIPPLSSSYRDLKSVSLAPIECKDSHGSSSTQQETDRPSAVAAETTSSWEEERRGCFPLLWESCRDLMEAAWIHTFGTTVACPSLLHAAALVAPALPAALTDIIFRSHGGACGADDEVMMDGTELLSLLSLTIQSTRTAMNQATLPSQRSTIDFQALHFARQLLQLSAAGAAGDSFKILLGRTVVPMAIQAGLTWNLYDDDRVTVGESLGDSLCEESTAGLVLAENGLPAVSGGWLQELFSHCPDTLRDSAPSTGLYPFQIVAATMATTRNANDDDAADDDTSSHVDRHQLDTIYNLLLACPDVFINVS